MSRTACIDHLKSLKLDSTWQQGWYDMSQAACINHLNSLKPDSTWQKKTIKQVTSCLHLLPQLGISILLVAELCGVEVDVVQPQVHTQWNRLQSPFKNLQQPGKTNTHSQPGKPNETPPVAFAFRSVGKQNRKNKIETYMTRRSIAPNARVQGHNKSGAAPDLTAKFYPLAEGSAG